MLIIIGITKLTTEITSDKSAIILIKRSIYKKTSKMLIC